MKTFLFSTLFLFYFAMLSAQDFGYVTGENAVYFEDIKSIEYRTSKQQATRDENWESVRKANIKIDSLEYLQKGAILEDHKGYSTQIESLQNAQNRMYEHATSRDSWNTVFTSPFTPVPILILNSSQQIQFAFDDFHSETTDYSYTVIPFSWDWSEQLNLSEGEYLLGFSTSRINDIYFPEITIANYTAYRFSFPNDEIKPTLSGNYLLVVYETNSEEVAFTRRIHISDQSFFFEKDIRDVSFDRDSLQFINFTVSYPKELNHLAPARDIKVVVLQNGRYDNAIIKEKPAHAMNNELRYGYQDKIGFQPGKEFRFLKMQTFDFAQLGVAKAHQGKEANEIYLQVQEERVYHPNLLYRDINGEFVTMNGVNNEEPGDPDYAYVYFYFDHHEPYYKADLYIVGKFTDWQFKDEFRLSYNDRDKRYEGEAFLKQGFYDYYYALKHANSDRIDTDRTEGHSFETSNDYTILVYYSTPNGWHDKLVLAKTISVNHR